MGGRERRGRPCLLGCVSVSTLHVLGLPHTATTGEYVGCAYTSRIVKFCRMMTGGDRKVVLYGSEQNEAPCDEHVVVMTEERRQHHFGAHDSNDLSRGGFGWEFNLPYWVEMNDRVVEEMSSRVDPHDIVCFTAGAAQRTVADAFPAMVGAEIMVGYEGILLRTHPSPVAAAFESHTHRHFVGGQNGWAFPRAYDTVIPNQFDPDELPYSSGGDYLLYLGRLVGGKAPQVAGVVADYLEIPLVVAGPGAVGHGPGWVQSNEVRVEANDLTYVGPVDAVQRAYLMGGAAVTIMPTIYQEPFGGVAVESMMCGTPVVATDYGAFVETVCPGVSGFTFSTVQEAADAVEKACGLPRGPVREWAMRYSLDNVAPMYDRWFGNLDSLWVEGWTGLRSRLSETILA